ncbi:hypothetical protein PFICI_14315 [Pestalotiopsis fici W106-1]|uniref:Methyltransferase type 11 domain-containing protein n=1 Tax=Pestalotiopsis fici (strain W106-1 / CGMCC3.15140) TaxID=1229662 RepID=W3WL25_PESFW|nr:uncharacterized protein PFICI_14315 [Pestalotiopsis fici W106-1]ETS74449.1 hypothetical protein PFICI_14315 [Pestalotiopsis fici W106-1]
MASRSVAQCALRVTQARLGTSHYLLWAAQMRTSSQSVRAASSGSSRRSTVGKSVVSSSKAKPLPFKSPSAKTKAVAQSSAPKTSDSSASTPENHGKDSGSSGSTRGHAPPPPPPRKFSIAELVRTRWIALFGAGAAALCLGSFTASFVWLNLQPAPVYCTGHEPQVPTGRPGIQSPLEFDLHLDKSEHRYGITKLRRKLGAEARGHVLEVAVGTGRNLEFYDWGALTARLVSRGERNRDLLEKSGWGRSNMAEVREVDSFTGVDISEDMLDIGLQRLRTVVPHGPEILTAKNPSFAALARPDDEAGGRPCLALLDGKLRILKGDAQDELPRLSRKAAPAVKDGRYDTVVQTFGLCSVRDPTRLLENMARVVRPGSGRIILIEHGRSWWDLVNGLLDRSASGHFERFGCWWNRDIEAIVEDAQKKIPALEVVEMHRPGWFKFGTHFWIELRVREDANTKEPPTAIEKPAQEAKEGSWSKWWDVGSSILTPKSK